MMNYLAQYTVLEYRLPSEDKCEMLKNTKVLGVFEADDEYKRVVDISLIDAEAESKEVLFFSSKAGGGANFPRPSKVYEATMQNHAEDIKRYMKNLKEQRVILIDAGDRYSMIIMSLLADFAKQYVKNVTCISVQPMKFMPKYIKKSFDFHWEELEQNVDQSVLYDMDAACIALAQEMGLNAKDYVDFRTSIYFRNVLKKLKHCDESIYTNTIVLQETELDYKKTDVTKV